MARVIATINLKGGVGKTTTTAALGEFMAAEFGQRVDDARAGLAHAGPEGCGEAHRARADDRDVADVVEVGVAHGARDCRAGTGSPSTALSARSTEVAMQVKLGVSRRV